MYISNWEDEVLKKVDPVCCFNYAYGNMCYSDILKHNREKEEKAQKDYEIALRDNELLSRGDKSRARKHISKPKAKELISLTPLYKKTRSALALRIGCIFIQLKTGKLSDGTWLTDYYVPNSPSSVKQRRIHSLRLIASFWCVIEKYFIDYLVMRGKKANDNGKFAPAKSMAAIQYWFRGKRAEFEAKKNANTNENNVPAVSQEA